LRRQVAGRRRSRARADPRARGDRPDHAASGQDADRDHGRGQVRVDQSDRPRRDPRPPVAAEELSKTAVRTDRKARPARMAGSLRGLRRAADRSRAPPLPATRLPERTPLTSHTDAHRCLATVRDASPTDEVRMELATFRYVHGNWSEPFPALDSERTMVMAFASPAYGDRAEPLAHLTAAFPTSAVIGCSTSGEIDHTRVRDGSIAVAVVRFGATRG